MKFLKKNKKITIGIIITILALLAIFFIVIFILPLFGHNKYGDRLEGMDQVEISSETKNNLVEVMEKTGHFESVEYTLNGRIINLVAVVKKDVKAKDAKEAASKVLDKLSKEEKEYYDVQVFLTQEQEESKSYPYIGYKSKTAKGFVWTNN